MTDDADRKLQQWIDRLAAMPELAARVAPDVAAVIEQELHRSIAAGVAPDGEPWEKTIEGKTPLRNAAAALTVRAIGTEISAHLEGPEALHHLGIARGAKRRPIIPAGELPPTIHARVREVLSRAYIEHMSGKGRQP